MNRLILITLGLMFSVGSVQANSANWKNICPDPIVDYCKNLYKYAYNNSTNHPSIRNIKLGLITGVAWRPKGSVIGISEGIASANIPQSVRTSPRDAYYYIILDIATSKTFLRQGREIDEKYEKQKKNDWMKKNDWINKFTSLLPSMFCKEAAFFRQCYKVNKEECMQASTKSVKDCLVTNDSVIPEVLVMKTDGTKLGGQFGQCAGVRYSQLLVDKFISNTKCNTPSNWQ